MENSEKGLVRNTYAFKFMIAGNSEFTLLSERTQVKFSYRLVKIKTSKNKWYVSVIHGQESIYAGLIVFREGRFIFYKGNKGKINNDDKRIQGVIYVLNNLYNRGYNIKVRVYQCGKCGKCGKRLTTPESIERGLGPVCSKEVEKEWDK